MMWSHYLLTRGAWAATGYSSLFVFFVCLLISESTYMYLDDVFVFAAWIFNSDGYK